VGVMVDVSKGSVMFNLGIDVSKAKLHACLLHGEGAKGKTLSTGHKI
jgi:hypothetical protein